MKKVVWTLLVTLAVSLGARSANEENQLVFNPARYSEQELTLSNGTRLKYRAYEHIYYVKNVEDSAYQYLNLYVPQSAYNDRGKAPIFLRTYIGGYMAARADRPTLRDATGRALQEGYVVCIPGSRGANSRITDARGDEVFTGRAPRGLLDLKAAVRYLHANDSMMPGNAERIITDGTSAGGAMSALVGVTGDHPDYLPMLDAMGTAGNRDDVFAAVCFCPITDLEHADMAYEWLYSVTNATRGLTAGQLALSQKLASLYPLYLKSLSLYTTGKKPLTAANYAGYLKRFIWVSAQKGLDSGGTIPASAGITVKLVKGKKQVTAIDLNKYLQYVTTTQPLKTPPAFDAAGVQGGRPAPENALFGDSTGSNANFTLLSLRESSGNKSAYLDSTLLGRIRLMNPMNYIADNLARTAPHWYIRHGARDRDTAFTVSLNLATRLRNVGADVNYALAWDRPHTGDYDLDELFSWLNKIAKEKKK